MALAGCWACAPFDLSVADLTQGAGPCSEKPKEGQKACNEDKHNWRPTDGGMLSENYLPYLSLICASSRLGRGLDGGTVEFTWVGVWGRGVPPPPLPPFTCTAGVTGVGVPSCP